MDNVSENQFLEDFADRWLRAWNSHDTDQVLDLLAEGVVWEDLTFWPEIINGRDGVRAYTDQIWRAMPDVHFEEIDRFFSPNGRRGIVLFNQAGSPPRGFEGRPPFSSHGCDIFLEFDTDGLLAHYMASYDITEMMRQMEMLPARGGLLGGSYLRSLVGTAG